MLGIALAASPALGGPRSKIASYKDTVDRGTAAFVAGKFDEAREAFEAAFELHPNPVLVFNIASCYRRAGDNGRALAEYRRFLDLAKPDDPRRVLATDTVATLERQVAPETAPPSSDAAATAAPAAAAPEAPAPAPRRSRMRPVGIGIAISGGVGLVASAVELIYARTLSADPVASATPPATMDPAIDPPHGNGQNNGNGHNDGGGGTTTDPATDPAVAPASTGGRDAANRRAIYLGVAGGALVATGVTLYLLGKRAERPLRLSVSAGAGGGALQLGGRF